MPKAASVTFTPVNDPKPKPETRPAGKPANPAGQVRHDKSGRAIWEWAVDTGRHALDSTSRLLKKLEIPGLALEEEVRRKKAEEQQVAAGVRQAPLAGSRGGFNPYDSRTPPPRKAAPAPTRAAARTRTPAPTSADKPGLFSRLFGARR